VFAAASLALLTFLAFSNSFSAGFILDNKGLLLHLGNVFLVYALARRLLREFWPSFFAAGL